MKNLIAAILMLMLASTESYAQWTTSGSNIYNSNTGNVGVATTIPLEKLHVQNGSVLISSNSFASYLMGTLKFSTTSYNYAWAGLSGNSNGQGWDQIDLLFYTAFGAPSEKMRLMANTGYLGIGTSTPLAKLDVYGDTRVGGTIPLNSSGNLSVRMGIINTSFTNLNSTDAFIGSLNTGGPAGLAGDLLLVPRSTTGINNAIRFYTGPTTPSERLTITYNGNVGIGTSTPAAKLSVNGNVFIGTQDANTITNMGSNNVLAVNGTAVFVKAKVAIYGPTTWPDYVFEPSYKMTTLDSLEQFIKLNKHLPEMPSAADVEKDGLDLGDNQALLLKKIEELTLIVIEQNKRIEELEKASKLNIEK